MLASHRCGSTIAEGTADASSFTLAFDGATGCFNIGVGAPCDPAVGDH